MDKRQGCEYPKQNTEKFFLGVTLQIQKQEAPFILRQLLQSKS